MQTTEFQVTGMTCGHCESAVRGEVSQVPGITDVEVSAQTGVLRVTTSDAVDTAAVIAAVEEAGYEAATV